MRIALDALGGDNAPQVNIEGALLAVKNAPENGIEDLKITLVGDRQIIDKFLEDQLPAGIDLLHVPKSETQEKTDPILDGDDPDSPIRTALRLHQHGQFDAVVSAGSTGAQVVASMIELGKIHGITRPAVGSFLPTTGGDCFIIDVGASMSASPHHLVQFATMGHVYVRELLGIKEPRIGVLNVGQESAIGDRCAIEAHRKLSDSGFNFIGFIEGRDIPAGAADIVVTNGFVGNVLLKFAEALPMLITELISNVQDSPSLKKFEDKFDYQRLGGEPLLGVNAVSYTHLTLPTN